MPDALNLLTTRRSVKPVELAGPAPSAAEIDTILRGFPLRDAPAWVDVLTICILGLAPPLLGLLLPIGWAIAGALALGFAYAALAQFAFDHGTVLAVLYPTSALVLATGAEPRRLAMRYLRDAWIFPQLVWRDWRCEASRG